MRLIYIHNIAMPGPEANTVNVAKMCNAFAANGCDVTLAVLPGAPVKTLGARLREHYDLAERFNVVALPNASIRPVIAALTGALMARRHNAGLAYTRTPHAALAACMAGIPTVLEAHADLDAFSGIGRAAFLRVARHPRLLGLVVISSALGERLRERLPDGPPIIVAHDGADAKAVAPPRAKNDRLAVGFASRFHRGKGLELIARIALLCGWADFHVVGGDAAAAKHALGATELPANMILHGAAPHARVAQFIDEWDVALAPYQPSVVGADGRTDITAWMSPLKIFEYMAAGKAILASDLPVLREILSHGDNALLLPPTDPEAWAAALNRLRNQPWLREELGASAHDAFLNRHTWTERARHILQELGAATPRKRDPEAPLAAATGERA